jgi:outer membrane protein OmpA-like peptidoglycan-associated protein
LKKVIGIAFIWALVLGAGAVAYKRFLDRPEDGTTTTEKKPPANALKLALDSFSGYCVFRSPEFKKKLTDKGLEFEWVDDKADYTKRMQTVKDGSTPLAVFTIDALITQTPPDGDPLAAIVLLIDETRGADAMISYRQGVPDIDALNSERAKIVLVENSPSETLARVVRSKYNLPLLPVRKKDYLITVDSAEDVLKKFLQAKPSERTAFVLWEPYVSQALRQPGSQRLVDSSDFKGYIVDVLVAQRAYLREHADRVQAVVRAYLEVLHERQKSSGGMADLVFSDAQIVEEKVNREQAQQVAKGIWWKNTVENYAHMGILPADQAKGLQPVGEMIKNITEVLAQTKQPDEPPPGVARADKLVADDLLRQLYEQRPPLHIGHQDIRDEAKAGQLTAEQWEKLQTVASMKVPPITFSSVRKDQLTEEAKGHLVELANELKQWPQYYLRIEGHTRKEGDLDANLQLAKRRAESVRDYLVEQQVPEYRLKAEAMPPGEGMLVRFVALRAR